LICRITPPGVYGEAAAMTIAQDLWAALRPRPWALTALAALLGGQVARACGCGADGLGALAATALLLFGHVAVQWRSSLPPGSARDGADVAGWAVIGAGVLLTARSGLGLAAVGMSLLLLGAWVSPPQVDGRPDPAAARRTGPWFPLVIGLCTALAVMAVDQAQRHTLSTMGAVVAVGPAWLVAAAEASAQAVQRRRPSAAPLIYGLIGHGWVAAWWLAQWLATQAWWALGALPLSVAGTAAALAGRDRLAARLAWAAAAAQMLLLSAALAAVAALR
jgi:hypothetical protein